jgi:XTP/dITP diphosphohydrolase
MSDSTLSTSRTIVLASASSHKISEFRRIFAGSSVDITSPLELGSAIEVSETGASYQENARLKAVAYALDCGLWALGDDSGLEIDALDGAPGIHSHRFAGDGASDADRNFRVLELLNGVPTSRRSARYRCAITIAEPSGTVMYETQAQVAGSIGFEDRGTTGFGYDPLFITSNNQRTMAEIGDVEKDVISHRGQAGRAARSFLERILTCADR